LLSCFPSASSSRMGSTFSGKDCFDIQYSKSRTIDENVIVFDWDDTICPSSFVDQWQIENFKDLPLHFQNLFNEIAKCAERCLAEASKHGEVILITNSDEGWVKYSAERYIPKLLPIIAKYKVVSARTRYERFYPSQPLCWKAAAFAHEVNEIYAETKNTMMDCDDEDDELNESCESLEATDVSSDSDTDGSDVRKFNASRRQVVSIGDGIEERTAVRIISEQLAAVPKSVMFITAPSPLQILGQLNMVTRHMKYVCEHGTSLDLEISPNQAQRGAEKYMDRNKVHFEERTLLDMRSRHLPPDEITVGAGL